VHQTSRMHNNQPPTTPLSCHSRHIVYGTPPPACRGSQQLPRAAAEATMCSTNHTWQLGHGPVVLCCRTPAADHAAPRQHPWQQACATSPASQTEAHTMGGRAMCCSTPHSQPRLQRDCQQRSACLVLFGQIFSGGMQSVCAASCQGHSSIAQHTTWRHRHQHRLHAHGMHPSHMICWWCTASIQHTHNSTPHPGTRRHQTHKPHTRAGCCRWECAQ
jgi:hypothetical protein